MHCKLHIKFTKPTKFNSTQSICCVFVDFPAAGVVVNALFSLSKAYARLQEPGAIVGQCHITMTCKFSHLKIEVANIRRQLTMAPVILFVFLPFVSQSRRQQRGRGGIQARKTTLEVASPPPTPSCLVLSLAHCRLQALLSL